jgi:hypothetical protein
MFAFYNWQATLFELTVVVEEVNPRQIEINLFSSPNCGLRVRAGGREGLTATAAAGATVALVVNHSSNQSSVCLSELT